MERYIIVMDKKTDCEFCRRIIIFELLKEKSVSICCKNASPVENCDGKLEKRPELCPLKKI